MPAARNVASFDLVTALNFVFALTLLVTTSEAINANEANARIVGGTVTDIANVPYLVNLRYKNNFICGGSLASTTHVITAAHCVKGVSANTLTVVGGATYLSDAGVRRSITKVFTPKAYNQRTLHSDVAVLKLSSPMTGSNIGTIDLCTSSWQVGEMIKVSGWGQTQARAGVTSRRLRSVEVALVARKSCARQYQKQGSITNTMFCATVNGQKDACDGDSGGPAVYKGQLCGIVSWGMGCARRNYPGVYTSVKSVRSFIDSAMNM